MAAAVKLDEDLEDLIVHFHKITKEGEVILEENTKLKIENERMDKQLAENRKEIEKLENDLRKKHELLTLVHNQLTVIPELKELNEKQRIENYKVEKKVQAKEEEIGKLKSKHFEDLNSLRIFIEEEKAKSRLEENKRMVDLEEFFKEAQSTELSSLMRKAEREKEDLSDLLLKKDEEIARLKTEHEEETEKLKVELVAAKSKETAAPTAIGSEFYRKKISALQSHYEKQIQDLEASRKSSGSTNQSPPMPQVSKSPAHAIPTVTSHQPSNPPSHPLTPAIKKLKVGRKVTFKLPSPSQSEGEASPRPRENVSIPSPSSGSSPSAPHPSPWKKPEPTGSSRLNEDFWNSIKSPSPSKAGFFNSNAFSSGPSTPAFAAVSSFYSGSKPASKFQFNPPNPVIYCIFAAIS